MTSSLGQVVQQSPQTFAAKADAIKLLKQQTLPGMPIEPQYLGDFAQDLVYTPIASCRIADTRVAGSGGHLTANTARTFDADGTTLQTQGGTNGGCGIPSGVAAAVAMTIHVINQSNTGALYAWGLGTAPTVSLMNYVPGQTISTNAIIPIVPGPGNDFSIRAQTNTDVVIDVTGYFAAPVATPLDCVSVASDTTTVASNQYVNVDAYCPAGYESTGGGTYPTEGTLGRPNIWTDGSPISGGWRTWVDNQTGASRTIQTYARCCRVPGR